MNVQGFFSEQLLPRAKTSQAKLRSQLVGSILIEFSDSGERYLFDWSDDQPKLAQTKDGTAECKIILRSDDFMRIASGDLNPQIAMLSEKIRVEGKPGLAIYFFNLVAPEDG